MADLFIKQAEQYAEGRPSYPPELFEFIASKTPSHDLAWDVGAGSGQAARSGNSMKGVDEVGAWVVIDGVVKWDGELLKGFANCEEWWI
nr:hypothetical protein CFP56_23153 [Quercus suber]